MTEWFCCNTTRRWKIAVVGGRGISPVKPLVSKLYFSRNSFLESYRTRKSNISSFRRSHPMDEKKPEDVEWIFQGNVGCAILLRFGAPAWVPQGNGAS